MILLIAALTGITDASAMIALFGVNAAMIFFGAVQEKYERPGGVADTVLARVHRRDRALDSDRSLPFSAPAAT